MEFDYAKAKTFKYQSHWDPKTPMMRVQGVILGEAAHLIPACIHPNAITIVCNAQFLLVALLLWVFPEWLNRVTGGWEGALLGAGCILRVVGDWVDGMHARNTKQTSVVGSYLDHAFDSVAIPITFIFLFHFAGEPKDGLCVLLAITITFTGLFFTMWGAYLAGVLHPDELAELIFGWFSPLVFFYPLANWQQSLAWFVSQIVLRAVLLGGFVNIVNTSIWFVKLPKKEWRASVGKGTSEFWIWLLPLLILALISWNHSDRALAIVTSIFLNGLICNHVIVAGACLAPRALSLHPRLVLCVGLTLVSSFWPLLGVLTSVVLWSVDFALHALAIDNASKD